MPVYNEAATVAAVLDADPRCTTTARCSSSTTGRPTRRPRCWPNATTCWCCAHPGEPRLRHARSSTASQFAQFARAEAPDHDGLRRAARAGAHPAVLRGAHRRGRPRLGQPLPARPAARRATRPRERREINDESPPGVNEVTGWQLTDAFCGFKAYHVDRVMALGLDASRATRCRSSCGRRRGGRAARSRRCRSSASTSTTTAASAQDLDDPEKRLAYYLRVWREALGGGGVTMADVVCVGAHPDDVEIGMGATVALHARAGPRRRCSCDLTDGEPTPHGTPRRVRARRPRPRRVLGVRARDAAAAQPRAVRTRWRRAGARRGVPRAAARAAVRAVSRSTRIPTTSPPPRSATAARFYAKFDEDGHGRGAALPGEALPLPGRPPARSSRSRRSSWT